MDEQSAEELLAHFPARDLDESVTRDFVRAELAEVRTEIGEVRTEIAELDKRLTSQIADVRSEITEIDKRLSTRLEALPNEIAHRYTRQTAGILAAITVATAILRFS
jgi:uncharacterized protein (DUF3084 family)